MDITLGFAVGIMIGAALGWFISQRRVNAHKLQQELNASRQQLEQYRLDVSSHLDTTHQLMSQLQESYQQIAQHVAKTKMQLIEKPSVTDNADFSFLASDTSAHLRQSQGQLDEKRRKDTAPIAEQPLDYAGQSSGIMKNFVTEKQ